MRTKSPTTGLPGSELPGTGLRERLRYPAAAATGILTVLAFPRYSQDYLIWITFVPLLWAATGSGPRRGFLSGWFAGLTLVSGGFIWVLYALRVFSGLGIWASILFLPWLLWESLPWGLLGLILGLLRRRGSGGWEPAPAWAFAAIPLWIGIEGAFPRLFPWQVGGALFQRSWLLQCADIFGAEGLSGLILLVNVVVYLWLAEARRVRGIPWKSTVLTLAILGAGNLYGWIRLAQVDSAFLAGTSLSVGVVQPAARPEERRAGEGQFFDTMEARTRGLEQNKPIDLILWPEGSDPMGYRYCRDKSGEYILERLYSTLTNRTGFDNLTVPLVAGTGFFNEPTDGYRNTAEYVEPGKWPPQFYHKNVLVLFGESVPLWGILPGWFQARLKNVGLLEAGKDNPLLRLPALKGPYNFRILICYEGILSGSVRSASRGADFLANITEDIWYGDTAHIPQHLSLLILRAVENRISIARAANVGPSGVIDPAGRMEDRTKPYEKCERKFSLHPVRLSTVYGNGGFLFPWFCLALGLFVFVRFLSPSKPGKEKNSRFKD